MPIIVKDYKWRESENIITLQVPLHGIHKSKVDLLTSEEYLKASFEKFFFEIFLARPIKVNASKCTINQSEIVYELQKYVPGMWHQIEKLITKEEKKEIKSASLELIQKRLTEEQEQKSNKRGELNRCSVSEAVKLDTKQRKLIEEIKTEEKTKALGDLGEWNQQSKKKTTKKPTMNFKFRRVVANNAESSDKDTAVPLPRSNRTLDVDFTPRTFPTPCRESKEEEETEWLRNQAAARRSVGFVGEDLRPEEKNPQYLLAKGDEFLKNENYLGAISAYSFGVELSPNFADLYIQRSKAQLCLGNFHNIVRDCSKALELLIPAVDKNLNERAFCIGRRGMALYKLGMKRQAIDELHASLCLKYDPEFDKCLWNIKNESEDSKEADISSQDCEKESKNVGEKVSTRREV